MINRNITKKIRILKRKLNLNIFGDDKEYLQKSMEKMKIFISIDTPNIHTINITSIKSQN